MKDILISILVASFLLAGCSGAMQQILDSPIVGSMVKGTVYQGLVDHPDRAVRVLEILAKGEGVLESTIVIQKGRVVEWIKTEVDLTGNPYWDFVITDLVTNSLPGWEGSLQVIGPEGRAQLALVIQEYRDVANLALAAQ